MNITLVTQWFPPEQAPIGYMIKELAETMAKDGHLVTVITGFPNHPTGSVFKGYQKKWLLHERVGNVDVIRVWLSTSTNRSRFNRILTFLTFTFTSAFALLIKTKPDLIFAIFQPLSVGITLPMLARIKRAKLVLNIQDLHPDVPIELGIIKNRLIIAVMKFIESYGYRHASALAVISESFKKHCVHRGAKAANVCVIPNWIDLYEIQPWSRNNSFREYLGLSEDHFVILYAGTIGLVSGAGVLLDAASSLRNRGNIRIVFIGDGPLVPDLKKQAEELGLNNVIFAPFQQREILSQVQAISDISVVSLGLGKGRTSVPSKVLGYMASARPILAVVDADSETANTVQRANAGWIIEPGNSEKIVELIRSMEGSIPLLEELGKNGRIFLEKNYARTLITKKYIDFFRKIIG
jgi:colanic acid biosynthesis glycosyl transferase WcaI